MGPGSHFTDPKKVNPAPFIKLARNHGAGGEVESHVARLGELLPCRHRQSCISCARQLHRYAVTPVVAQQAQGQATQGRDLSTLAPLWVFRSHTSERARWRSVA